MEMERKDQDEDNVSRKINFEREYINLGQVDEVAPFFRFIKRTVSAEVISDWYDRVHVFLQ